MVADSYISGDVCFLDILKPMVELKKIIERKGSFDDLIVIADLVSKAFEVANEAGLLDRIEKIIKAQQPQEDDRDLEPFDGFDDVDVGSYVGVGSYGSWRSKNNEADYGAYLNALEREAERLRVSQSVLDSIKWFRETKISGLDLFTTIRELLRISVSLNRFVTEMTIADHSITLVAPLIDLEDTALCINWSNKKINGGCMPGELSEILGSYEARRLLSARAAEKAVANYYRCLGEQVQDISIGQLLNTGNSEWKDFDLLVGGRPIDVKNSRESFSSPETYVEHCVPKFKSDRKYGVDVSITGVLSKYGTEEEILSGELTNKILGEVNVSSIRIIYSWMRRRFGALINLNGLWKQGYVPGWMFEYPDAHYAQRNIAVIQLAEFLIDVRSVCKTDKVIPGWLLTLCANSVPLNSLDVSDLKIKILADLSFMNGVVGFSRASLYLYVMGIMLESLMVAKVNDPTDVLKDLLFFNGDAKRPLFLLDSQKYVFNLVNLMSCIRQEAARRKMQFTGFLMPHPSILLGLRNSRAPVTLIAYCGGWFETPFKVKCGEAPLHFGKNHTCPSCNHLICNKCGHCARGCPLVAERQSSTAHASTELDE